MGSFDGGGVRGRDPEFPGHPALPKGGSGTAPMTTPDPAVVYTYSFAVWPEENHPRWTKAVYHLFRLMGTRLGMDFTERQFNDFREELAKCGLSLREIDRVPFHESEVVL